MPPKPHYNFNEEKYCRDPYVVNEYGHRELCPSDKEYLADLAKIRRQAKSISQAVVDWLEN